MKKNMKTILVSSLVFIQSCFCFSQSMVDSLYLGKPFPGNIPVVFLDGITERIAISSDGKDIFFNSSNGLSYYHYSNNTWDSPKALFNGFGNASLSVDDSILYMQNSQPTSYFSLKNKTDWSTPVLLWNNSITKHHIQVTNSGTFYVNTLTTHISSHGDIAKVETNGSDITFQNLPSPINTKLNGQDFYISKDESYIILVEIINGSGDLYISYKKTDTTWTNPKNLGSHINSSDWEYGPYVSPDNKYLFFSRSTAFATYWVKLGNMIDTLQHTNFSPYLLNQIKSQTDSIGQSFNFTVPDNTFIDDDGNNTLSYSATLSNGSTLPSWLSFNAANQTFFGIPTTVGSVSLKVTATDTAMASISTTFTLNIAATSSVKQIYEQNIQIYPNPTKDKINIVFGSIQYKTAIAEITDLSGKLISSDTYRNVTNASIDVRNSPKGIYILNLIIDGKGINKKICVE